MERMLTDLERERLRLEYKRSLEDKIKQWETLERLIEASEWLKDVKDAA